MTTFIQVKEKYFDRLNQFVPIVDRVHGNNHPEFHEVKGLWDAIYEKTTSDDLNIPNLDPEFERLREVTDHYKVPDDVCESYEAVYHMLEEVDSAYTNES